MHHDHKIPHREDLYVTTYIRLANWGFGNFKLRKCYQLGRVACLAEVVSAPESAVCIGRVKVHLFLCICSMSADSLWCHFGKEGSRTCGFDEAYPGVFLSQPSPFFAQETQHPTFSLLGPGREDSWPGISFPLLRHVKSLLWPFCPYSRPGTCRTVAAVPNLLA